jgi:hypothetical protein
MNIGVWYNPPDKTNYRRDLKVEFLPFMHAMATHDDKQSNVVFQESVVQHWETKSGDYTKHPPPPGRKSRSFCQPLSANYSLSLSGDWRNYLVRQELTLLNSEHISLLPIAEALIGGHTLHMSADDCTHMCFFPTLFQFQWHALQYIAERNCVGRNCYL